MEQARYLMVALRPWRTVIDLNKAEGRSDDVREPTILGTSKDENAIKYSLRGEAYVPDSLARSINSTLGMRRQTYEGF